MIINFFDSEVISENCKGKIKSLFDWVLQSLNQPEDLEISISFVSEEEIKEVNSATRNVDKVTDVLSFPFFNLKVGEVVDLSDDYYLSNVNPETSCFLLGDMLICSDYSKKQAEELNNSFEDEVIKLALHSLLHCLGYDHIEDSDYEIMHALEEKILSENGYKINY